MSHMIPAPATLCLTHQRVENHSSPLGRVCAECAAAISRRGLHRPRYAFWESQPPVYSLDGRPQFVYTLHWDDFRIRSLHPASVPSGRDAIRQKDADSLPF